VHFRSFLVAAAKMKQQNREEKRAKKRQTLDRLCSVSGLLLSVVCCIALIHVEIRIQEHHRLISHSVTFCDKMEREILRKVEHNYGKWQVMATSRHWQTTAKGRFAADDSNESHFVLFYGYTFSDNLSRGTWGCSEHRNTAKKKKN